MNIKKLALSLFTAGILASAPINVLALSNYTLNGNYVITGDLYVDSLLGHVGQCLEVGTGPLGASEIVATGSPCGGGGGGGVTSVTAGPNGNITAAPTTGAVIVDEINDPIFTNVRSTVTGNIAYGSVSEYPLSWVNSSNNPVLQDSDGTFSIAGITNTDWGLRLSGSPGSNVLAFNGTS
jgi:hypothetical protein